MWTAPLCRGLAPEAHTSVIAQLSAAIIRFLTETGRDPLCFSPASEARQWCRVCVSVCVCVCMHACWEQTTKKKEEGLNISASVLSHIQLNSLQLYGLQLLCHGFSATARLFCSWDSLGKNTGMGCHFLLLEIFPIQGSNLCFLHLPVFAGGFSTTEPPRKPC